MIKINLNAEYRKHFKIATLKFDIKGKFSSWKKGQVVKTFHVTRNFYMIERMKWRHPVLPALNQLVGVPRSDLDFMPRTIKTQNDGASAERLCWMRKVRREMKLIAKAIGTGSRAWVELNSLHAWGATRIKRTAKKAGGLGRR